MSLGELLVTQGRWKVDQSELTLMRKSEAAQFVKTVAATNTPLASRNFKRVAIVISADETNDIWVSMGTPAAVGTGVLIPARTPPLMLSIDQYGMLAAMDFNAIAIAGTATVTVWEVDAPL